jgi:hypothetical protein
MNYGNENIKKNTPTAQNTSNDVSWAFLPSPVVCPHLSVVRCPRLYVTYTNGPKHVKRRVLGLPSIACPHLFVVRCLQLSSRTYVTYLEKKEVNTVIID